MFPKIIEELPVITLKHLRVNGLFAGWYATKIHSNGLTVTVTGYLDYFDDSRIKLEWEYFGRSMVQYIPLVRVTTNLGEDYFRWFFTDYDRDIKFMKAYFDGQSFKPRIDLKNIYYRDQLKSRSLRDFDTSLLKPLVRADKALHLLGKWSKTHYREKPTPRMIKARKLVYMISEHNIRSNLIPDSGSSET
jgi:hypothetical protein